MRVGWSAWTRYRLESGVFEVSQFVYVSRRNSSHPVSFLSEFNHNGTAELLHSVKPPVLDQQLSTVVFPSKFPTKPTPQVQVQDSRQPVYGQFHFCSIVADSSLSTARGTRLLLTNVALPLITWVTNDSDREH